LRINININWQKVLRWRFLHLTDRQVVYGLSVAVGILSGLAAIVLKNTVHYTHLLVSGDFGLGSNSILLFLSPIIGIALTVFFVKRVVKDDISHGVSRVLYAIARNSGLLKVHHMFSSVVASTFTIAFGGSVGAEAPIVLTGSAIGSNLGRWSRVSYKHRILLIGCGSAGAIAGIFKAPIAGIVFAVEVLMLDLTLSSLIPLLLSTATASVISYFFLGKEVLFAFPLQELFELNDLPFYLLLGIFTGFYSLYFTKASAFTEELVKRLENPYSRLAFGGLVLGILIYLLPVLYGEGYDTLKLMLNGRGNEIINESIFGQWDISTWLFPGVLLIILLIKVIAMALTNAAGGIGGVFAPSLFAGGLSGLFFARSVNLLLGAQLPETHFVLVGMAGVMAGVMHAPLTGIFLIAEITGGYQLLTPLMITAAVSYITIHYFEPHSIYTKTLAERGELMTHHKDKAVLSLMNVSSLIETNFKTVKPDFTLGEFVKVVAQSERNVFPVVDDENNYLGVVFINDIRNIIFDHTLYDKVHVRDLMFMPDVQVSPSDSMEEVAMVFQRTQNYNLPVIDKGKYVGFVSRANVFSQYRKLLKEFSED
jgi:CIC family chloride channel protein